MPMAELEGPSHIMRYVNPAFCRLLGKSKAALIGKPFAETMEDKNRCLGLLDRVYLTGEPETHTGAGHSEIGSPYWFYAMWPVLDAALAVGVGRQTLAAAGARARLRHALEEAEV